MRRNMEWNVSMRSGLKIIPGRAWSYFCAIQGERSAVDRESMSDEPITEEMCIVAPALRVGPEISASGVAALGNSTTIPYAQRLAITDFRTQRNHG